MSSMRILLHGAMHMYIVVCTCFLAVEESSLAVRMNKVRIRKAKKTLKQLGRSSAVSPHMAMSVNGSKREAIIG